MTSLADKLKELGVQVGTGDIQVPNKKQLPATSLVDVLPGGWESTDRGECFVVRKQIPLGKEHGRCKLPGAPDLSFFATLDHFGGIAEASPEEYLFIDTETTGLSGGAGSYVFLVGAAKYERESLHLAQFFLQDPGSESAQLAAFENFAASSRVIISYNGKSFDLPRIKTRFRYHGWPDPFSDIYHLDLLHYARRLWKSHLPGCSLGDLEHHLLGLQRDSLDIPGWQVSEFFYTYLRTGDPAPLENIFYHNEVDVISLAALLDYIATRLVNPLSREYRKEPDLISIGKYLISLRRFEESREVLSTALVNPALPEELLIDGKQSLAAVHKHFGDFELAAPIWRECASQGSIDSLIELAKYAEHKLNDFEDAIHWTLSAFDALESYPPPKQSTLALQLEHRLERLKKKAQR